jgi:hypothetical protein
MYPYITLGSITLYMTWLGLLLWALVFLWTTHRYAKKHALDTTHFFGTFSLWVIIIYLLGTYTWYLIEDFVLFPIDRQYRVLYLSPYGYKFHFLWIVAGLMTTGRLFLKKVPVSTHDAWISTLCHAFLLSLLPIGIWLVLWDNFIGKPVESGRYVSALLADSKVAAYDRVIPLWLYLALFGVIGHLALAWREWTTKRYAWYRWWGTLFLFLGILLISQQYARHIVIRVAGNARDIKQYVAFGLALWRYYKAWKKSTTLP